MTLSLIYIEVRGPVPFISYMTFLSDEALPPLVPKTSNLMSLCRSSSRKHQTQPAGVLLWASHDGFSSVSYID